MGSISKTLITFYRDYKIYKIVDAVGNVFYNAHSDYIKEGFITVLGDTLEEIHYNIDKVYQRKALLRSLEHNR